MAEQNRRDFLRTGVMAGTAMTLGNVSCTAIKKGGSAEEAMSVFDVIRKRRSVRSYKPTPVLEEHIVEILNAARMAPTSGNQQPWKFIVVKDRAKLDELKDACINGSIARYKERQNPTDEEVKGYEERLNTYYEKIFSAPVFIVVLVDMESKWPTYNKHDGPLAAGYLMLAARALGYGTVYFTDSIPDQVTKEVLTIPDRYERICITPVGVPEEWPETPEKKALDEFIVHDSF